MIASALLLALGISKTHAGCPALEASGSPWGYHRASQRPFLEYGGPTNFFDPASGTWFTLTLSRPHPGKGHYGTLVINHPLALHGTVEFVSDRGSLFSPRHELTFLGRSHLLDDIGVVITYDQNHFMFEPSLRLRGIPLEGVSIRIGRTTVEHRLLQPVRQPPQLESLSLPEAWSSTIKRALNRSGFSRTSFVDLGVTYVETIGLLNFHPANLTQAAVVYNALKTDGVSADNPIFTHPAIIRVRETLRR